MKMDEAEMIRRCRSGDRQAQRMLYDRYQTQMFRLCFRYVREQQEAEDVLCKGFCKIFQHFAEFEERGPNSLQKWITRIMVNEALMVLRKAKIELVSDDEALSIPAGTRTDSAIEAEELYNMVRALPIGYRTVFNLYAIEGYSHAEIAAQLGITEGTSKSQLSKARTMLQSFFTSNDYSNAKGYRPAVSKGHPGA